MPTYEYRCPEGHVFDVFQRMSDEPGASCPTCGAAAERMISAGAGLLFKGSGFYITDYRSDDYAKKKSAESGESKSGGSEGTGSGSSGSAGSEGSSASSSASSSDASSSAKGD